jgi:hypothetical protein
MHGLRSIFTTLFMRLADRLTRWLQPVAELCKINVSDHSTNVMMYYYVFSFFALVGVLGPTAHPGLPL